MAQLNDRKILFIHGLESGANGSKVQMMRQMGLQVHAEEMHMSMNRLDKQNSMLRNVFRQQEVQVAALLTSGLLGWSVARKRWVMGALAVGGGAGWWMVRREEVVQQAVRGSYEACVSIQREAVERYQPDVVIGSSWGGAVAIELILRGYWRGPTVLLAPAFHRAARRMGSRSLRLDVAALKRASEGMPIVIYHDIVFHNKWIYYPH